MPLQSPFAVRSLDRIRSSVRAGSGRHGELEAALRSERLAREEAEQSLQAEREVMHAVQLMQRSQTEQRRLAHVLLLREQRLHARAADHVHAAHLSSGNIYRSVIMFKG